MGAPVEAIEETERTLGVAFPRAIVSLLRKQNGFVFELDGERYRLLGTWDKTDARTTGKTFEDIVRETREWREARGLFRNAVVIAVSDDGATALFLKPDAADATRLAGRVWAWSALDREASLVAESILHVVAP